MHVSKGIRNLSNDNNLLLDNISADKGQVIPLGQIKPLAYNISLL